MLRIKFTKPCHVAGKTHAVGAQIDVEDALAAQVVALGAAEVLGPSEHYQDPAEIDIQVPQGAPSLLGKLKNVFTR